MHFAMEFPAFPRPRQKCLVCGDNQPASFVDLSARMSHSNTPVQERLRAVIKYRSSNDTIFVLCTQCFAMVDRCDALETELLLIRGELNSKFIKTLSPEDAHKFEEEMKMNHGLHNWHPSGFDLLQSVIKYSAAGNSGLDSSLDDSMNKEPKKKRPKGAMKGEKTESSPTGSSVKSIQEKSGGMQNEDTPVVCHAVGALAQDEDTVENSVAYEYDNTYRFLKQGERVRTGKIINEETSLPASLLCVYCKDSRGSSRDMVLHVASYHKPQAVSTTVPTDDGGHQEHFFGARLVKVDTGSIVAGRPFICIFCDGTFKFKSNLLQHFRENHSPHKPFSCSECPAKFRKSIDVSRHRVYFCPNKRSD